MSVTIRFSRETVKELMARLRLAIRQLNRPLIQQISALLLLDDGLDVWTIAARVGVSTTAAQAAGTTTWYATDLVRHRRPRRDDAGRGHYAGQYA